MLSNAKRFESLKCMKPANVTDEDVADEAKAQSYRGSGGGEGKVQSISFCQNRLKHGLGLS